MGSNKRTDGGGPWAFRGAGEIKGLHKLTIPDKVKERLDCNVLGFDIGTRRLGVTVLRSGMWLSVSTVISSTLPSKAPWYAHGLSMMPKVDHWITIAITVPYDQEILVAGLEIPAVYDGRGDTPVRIGDIRGMIMQVLTRRYSFAYQEEHSLILIGDVRPSSAKLALTGDGQASKEMMVAEAQKWNPRITSHDEADSIGIAVAALNRYKENQ